MVSVSTIVILVLVYLIGSFPTGYLVARSHGVAIHEQGSGNVGATNVARVVGKKAGILTLVGDMIKGLAGVGLARLVWPDGLFVSVAAFVVVAGHCISIPGKLKGGKGVATSLGAFLALYPPSALIGVITFSIVLASTKIVSLGSIGAAVAIPLFALVTGVRDDITASLCAISIIVTIRHTANLQRLVLGTEPRFGSSKTERGAQ